MAPKRKLTKKEKARMEAEQAELARVEMEKEKMRKVEEARQRKERDRAEAEKRLKREIMENKLRRIQLKKSSEFLKLFGDQIRSIYAELKVQKEWNRFMRCNGLPNSQEPSDLRRYIHIWCKKMEEENRNETNWLLKINESSILTQNQTVTNLTSEHIRSQLPNLGDVYSKQIKEVLGILDEIQEAIADMNKTGKKSILTDLNELKTDFRVILDGHIDEFSFKILCNINRDMVLETPVNAVHLYESDVFKSQHWTIRDIPQPPLNPKEKLREETKPTEVIFEKLGLHILFPPSIKCKGAAFRGVWLSYDNYSDYCPSYYMPYKKKSVKDLRTTTKIEWFKRLEILQSTLDQPEEDPEFDMMDQEAESATPKTGIVDVEKMYMEYEDAINREERKKRGPDALFLADFEVNLRKCRIVGGIFCIDFLEQPRQDLKIFKKTYIRTVVYPNKLTRKPFYEAFIPPPPPLPGVRRLPEEIEAEMKYMEKNLERLVLITIQLTDNVLWFEPPTVCRWETYAETEISIEETNRMKRENPFFQMLNVEVKPEEEPVKSKHTETSDEKADALTDGEDEEDGTTKLITETLVSERDLKKKRDRNVEKRIRDFNLHEIPRKIDLDDLMLNFVLPRLPDGYGIKMQIEDRERRGSVMRYIRAAEERSSLAEMMKRNDSNSKEIYRISNDIDDVLYETGSPRALFPHVIKSRKLKILPVEAEESSESSMDENDDSAQMRRYLKMKNRKVYMFSKFIKDLDDLIQSKRPNFKSSIDDIQIELIAPGAESEKRESEEKDSERTVAQEEDDYGTLFLRKSVDKSPEVIVEVKEDSVTSSDLEMDALGDESSDDEPDVQLPVGRWTTRDIHDAKFNEDKLTIQFRTGRLGYFGIAANRYSNFPYQTWEVKPDSKNPDAVIFSLTASVVSIEVTLTVDGVRLNSMQGGSLTPLQSIIDVTLPLDSFMKFLRSKAVDLFPGDDAFCYTEGSCEKNAAMENHLYECMGALAVSHNFSWSRWNLLSGSRTAVLLMREMIESKKNPQQLTLYVTPLKACIIDCLEVSPSFNSAPIQGMEYYADLNHLVSVHSKATSKEKQSHMSPLLRDNVVQLLKATKPLSFS